MTSEPQDDLEPVAHGDEEQDDLELLAAFLENRLPPAKRAELAAMIVRSPGLYEVFADAAALRAAGIAVPVAAGQGAPSPVMPEPPHFLRWQVLLPAAAAVLAVFWLAPMVWHHDTANGAFALGIQSAGGRGSFQALFDSTWLGTRVPARRSGAAAEAPARELGFRAGVRFTDLRVAWELADTPAMRLADRDLRGTLDAATPLSPPVVALVAAAEAVPPQPGVVPASRHREWQAAAAGAPGLFPAPWFEIGLWAEQAAMAVRLNRPAYFARDGEAAKQLDALVDKLGNATDSAGSAVLTALRSVQRTIAGGVTAGGLSAITPDVDALFQIVR